MRSAAARAAGIAALLLVLSVPGVASLRPELPLFSIVADGSGLSMLVERESSVYPYTTLGEQPSGTLPDPAHDFVSCAGSPDLAGTAIGCPAQPCLKSTGTWILECDAGCDVVTEVDGRVVHNTSCPSSHCHVTIGCGDEASENRTARIQCWEQGPGAGGTVDATERGYSEITCRSTDSLNTHVLGSRDKVVAKYSLINTGGSPFELTPGAPSPAPAPGAAARPISVVLMAGQSNMVGIGDIQEGDTVEGVQIATLANSRWLPLTGGYGATPQHIGPEIGLAQAWVKARPDEPLAIIKVALGDTLFGTGEWPASTGWLYRRFEAAVAEAMAQLPGPGQVVGMFWYQGEGDATQEAWKDAYAGELEALVTSVRKDVGEPDMPFVATLISCTFGWPYCAEVRNATRSVASTLQHVVVVDADGLPVRRQDPAHLTDAGVREIGRRYYAALAGELPRAKS